MVRHGGIHFAGQLDEARGEIIFARFPRKIIGVHRDAVAAEARAGIKGHEAEGLGRGAVDNFPDIQIHAQAKLLQLVHQRDVHAAKYIFEQLHHLRRARGADRNHLRNDLRVESRGGAAARRIRSANHFRNLRQAVLLVAGIFALGRKGKIEIGSDVFRIWAVRHGQRKPPFSRIGRTNSSVVPGYVVLSRTMSWLRLQVRRDRLCRVLHVAQIWLAPLVERRGHADQDRVHVAQPLEIRSGVEMLGAHMLA